MNAFSGYVFSVAASGAGNYSLLQLFNPLASGKIIRVDAVNLFDVSVSNGPFLAFYDTALTNLLAGTTFNMDRRQNASISEIRHDNTISPAVFTATASPFEYFPGLLSTPYNHKFSNPVFLAEGEGLVIRPGNTNTANTGGFEWSEIVL